MGAVFSLVYFLKSASTSAGSSLTLNVTVGSSTRTRSDTSHKSTPAIRSATRFGTIKEEKLLEVLNRLRTLFAASEARPDDSPRERAGPGA